MFASDFGPKKSYFFLSHVIGIVLSHVGPALSHSLDSSSSFSLCKVQLNDSPSGGFHLLAWTNAPLPLNSSSRSCI